MKNRTNILCTVASASALLFLAACEQKSSKPAPAKTESAAKSAGESAGKAAAEGAKAASETQKAVSEAAKEMPKEE